MGRLPGKINFEIYRGNSAGEATEISSDSAHDEFCGLPAAIHNEEIRRNDKSARPARVAVPKSKNDSRCAL